MTLAVVAPRVGPSTPALMDAADLSHRRRSAFQILAAALPAASSTGSQTGENGGA